MISILEHKESSSVPARLSARDVDVRLRRAIGAMQNAERSVFLWFCEIERRRLYRDLGYASIHAYASDALGFTANRIGRYLNLMKDLEDLPVIRAALLAGKLGWTKARVIVRVASAANEADWLDAALRMSRRELEVKIAEARAVRREDVRQPVLIASRAPGRQAKRRSERPVFRQCATELSDEGKTIVTFRLTATDLARYEALIEKLQKQGRIRPGTPREEILLQALAALSASDESVPRGTAAVNPPVHIHMNEGGSKATIQTQHGPTNLSRAELEAAECDAVISQPGERNRATIPPSVRRAVLTRDQHRCRAPGCGNAHFLEIHHLKSREDGGSNRKENLITLCSRCHRLWHERHLGCGQFAKVIE